jgi:hypothetical protein
VTRHIVGQTPIIADNSTVPRTLASRFADFSPVQDYGASASASAAVNDAAFQAARTARASGKAGIIQSAGGPFATSSAYANNVDQLLIWGDRGSALSLLDGTSASPNSSDDCPVLWVQKYTNVTHAGIRQKAGGIFADVQMLGSGDTANPTKGTWTAIMGSATISGSGSAGSYDANGDVVGVAGFARSTVPLQTGRIITGMWAYPEGPTIDSVTYAGLSSSVNWSICGLEVNIKINHPDHGVQNSLVGQGSSVGVLLQNYRDSTLFSGAMDWTFGQVFAGTPYDGNFSSTSASNWSGFHTGILIDHIKSYGIRFSRQANSSYGIHFPTSYSAYGRPAAAIHLGDNVIAMATAFSGTPTDGDFFSNGTNLFIRQTGVSAQLLAIRSNIVTIPAGGVTWSINGGFNFKMSTVANAVNYLTCFNAAANNIPAIEATGSDTDIGMELRAKGAGNIWLNGNVKFGTRTAIGSETVTGYITITDSGGTTRKLAVVS